MKSIIERSVASKKRIAAIVLCALMLISIFGAAAENNPAEVTVACDGIETVYRTYDSTVEDFLRNADINLKDNDYISHTMTAPISSGMRIVIKIAKYVTVHDEGKTYASVTYAPTVSEVMEDFEAPLNVADGCYPEREARAYDGLVVYVTRANHVIFTRGGSRLEYYTHSETVGDFLNEIGVVPTEEEKVVPSVDTVITSGVTVAVENKRPPAMSPLDFGIDLSNARVITCEATAYTSAADECWPYANGLTATGVPCQVGVVAVDPRVIPLKSKLYIETADGSFVYGYCTAEDTGGAIKGNKVDLAMNTKADCFQFGRRKVKVYILS